MNYYKDCFNIGFYSDDFDKTSDWSRYYLEDIQITDDLDITTYPEFDDYDIACLTDNHEAFEKLAFEYKDIEIKEEKMAA